MNDTSNSPIGSYARRMAKALDDEAAAKAVVKEIREEVKGEGFNLKAFNQAVKDLRKPASKYADQLEFELEVKTYRDAVGLTTDLAAAQDRAREEAESVPEPKSKGRDKRKDLN